jgi:hypothetical protein
LPRSKASFFAQVNTSKNDFQPKSRVFRRNQSTEDICIENQVKVDPPVNNEWNGQISYSPKEMILEMVNSQVRNRV